MGEGDVDSNLASFQQLALAHFELPLYGNELGGASAIPDHNLIYHIGRTLLHPGRLLEPTVWK